jgi:hypothetical protein
MPRCLLTYLHWIPTEQAIGIMVDVQAHLQKKRFIAYLLLVLSLAGLYHTAVAYKRFVDNVLIEIGRTFLWGVTPMRRSFSGLVGHGLSPSLQGQEKCMTLLESPQNSTAGSK